jgi:hypothetical protein
MLKNNGNLSKGRRLKNSYHIRYANIKNYTFSLAFQTKSQMPSLEQSRLVLAITNGEYLHEQTDGKRHQV